MALQATGGDDCQVEVFDSSSFNSNGMVSGLVGSILSVRVGDEAEGASITALAWHPSGLILAGTNLGKVDAFEVGQSEPENVIANFPGDSEQPFLVRHNMPPGRPQFGSTVSRLRYHAVHIELYVCKADGACCGWSDRSHLSCNIVLPMVGSHQQFGAVDQLSLAQRMIHQRRYMPVNQI